MNTGRTRFKKGHVPHNKGSGTTKSCLSCNKDFYYIGKRVKKFCTRDCFFKHFRGENHPMWRGNDAKYAAMHDWIEEQLGKPRQCDQCGTTNSSRFDWHNISTQYKRNVDDWTRLCTVCHAHKHKNWEKRWNKDRA